MVLLQAELKLYIKWGGGGSNGSLVFVKEKLRRQFQYRKYFTAKQHHSENNIHMSRVSYSP